MDEIIIQKISEGDSGARAAEKIYSNDKKLKEAVRAIKDTLNAYGSLIDITVSGGTITLVQEPGSGTTLVMSQKAVTDLVIDETENACQVGEVIETNVQMPSTSSFVDIWATRASANAEGNSLTVLYDDVQELKSIYNDLNERVTRIEEIINQS